MRNNPRSVDLFIFDASRIALRPGNYLRQILWQMLHCLTKIFLSRLLKWRRSEAPDRICYDTDGSADEWETRFA